uniref:CTP synthase N-terminal domain-containing protein n=1 Tax=Panagrolaimus davidi TaxID=227884 RepID=A0A914PW00_9BILA
MYNGNKIGLSNYVSAIIEWIKDVCNQPVDEKNKLQNICIIELCGDIDNHEMIPFTEALKYFKGNKKDFMHINISKIVGKNSASLLTFVQKWRNKGWNADIIICRSNHEISETVKEEIAAHSSLQLQQVN